MSVKGIKKVTAVLTLLQQTRIELIGTGVRNHDNHDIYLAQTLEDGHNAMKDRFTRLTMTPLRKKK